MKINKDIELLQGDCLKLMKDIQSESVDLIVTDPPYLINYKTNYRKNKKHNFCSPIAGDNDKKLISNAISESYRVLKNNSAMYIFCNSNKIEYFKFQLEKSGFKIKNIIVWVKNNWSAGDTKAAFGKQYEFIILANKGRKFFNGKRLTDVWFYDRVSGKKQLHQNQKPLSLIEQCILKHSDKNEIVLDPFMGSGTTGVACMNTNRKFIGMELDEQHFNISKKRINKTYESILSGIDNR